jgi:hypothetical protein
MPNTFNIIDEANIILGDAKLFLPTGIENTPQRNFGKLNGTTLRVEGAITDLETQMPQFTLKRYLMGQKATLTAESWEPLAAGNLDLLSGSTAAEYAVWSGVVLASSYTADEQTIVLTGDLTSLIAIGDYLKVYESGVGTEFFMVTKFAVSGDTTVTLPLGDTLQNTYTTAALVSRAVSQKTTFGKYANLSGATGTLLFEEFQPQTAGIRKVLVIKAFKMALPHSFELALATGEWIKSPIEVELLADSTQVNGSLLGEFYIYDVTV